MTHMKQLIREPLVHFLLLGAAIFAGYTLVTKGSGGEPGKIVITQGQLASMLEGFTATRQRTPTQEEWEGFIRARVREEVSLPRGPGAGPGQRRHNHPPPSAAEDRIRLRRRGGPGLAGRCRAAGVSRGASRQVSRAAPVHLPPGVSRPEKHGANLDRDTAQLLAALNRAGADADPAAMGDAILLDHDVTAMPIGEIGRQFGDQFAAKLGGLPRGQWQGPVDSAFGLHLVFVREHTGGPHARAEGRARRGAPRMGRRPVRPWTRKRSPTRRCSTRYTVVRRDTRKPVAATVATARLQ